ncbi:HAD-IIIA family hydrolase [Paenibacillus paeoniae]|uniref:D,D-heptose 1,7-bisphosphate phosphatase n=1 Tax=Paenibacillus paeoniae TaxID=2292705 RepID=A0A371P210_9BACL|nr:HAD-IIIA family hydrolase [Paenibacillus paeoniae]REK69580.1 HAD-IIIA family hydrolase [Paenibacillus paeoniae]
MQAVIMAGGKGTRLHSITKNEIPKPLALINDRAILEWQIECLKANQISKIIIVTGHLGEKIEAHFGNGAGFGVDIDYYREVQPLGSAGALHYVKEWLTEDYFLLVYGDVLIDIDLIRMEQFHIEKQSMATLFVHPNSHPYDSDLVMADESQRVIGFDSKHNKRDYWYNNCVNAGLYILDSKICDLVNKEETVDLEKELLFPLVSKHSPIYAYSSPEYIKDVGTADRFSVASAELSNGFVAARNLKKKQKCIFLDRDGTINRHKGLISTVDDFELEDCAIEAIKKINRSGYLAIVITNQPVVARGLCDISEVITIHNKMQTLLGEHGAILDDILFCPHHPDKGFPEENILYKIPCNCRKPGLGMIESCVNKYNIDLAASWIIGDTTIDIQTGTNAGMHTALVLTGEAGKDMKYDVQSDLTGSNLLEAVEIILTREDELLNGLSGRH